MLTRLNLLNYKASHLLAFFATIGVHATIAASSFLPSDPVVLNKQAIQISFVAPSGQNRKSDNSSHEKMVMKTEKEHSIKNKKEEAKKSKKSVKKSFAGKETSGRVHKDAIATRSVDSKPVFDAKYLNNPAPYYPRIAKKKKIQGKVFLNVMVTVNGTAERVEVLHSSGHSMLDLAALDAVQEWRFIPAKRSGKPVSTNVIVPVEFKII